MDDNTIEDRLVWLLKCFELNASVFQVGPLQTPSSYLASNDLSYIHILRSGSLLVKNAGKSDQLLDEPSVFFYMNPQDSHLIPQDNVDIICASFSFGAGLKNPLMKALPDMIVVKQVDAPSLTTALNFLFSEAEEEHCGRQAILDRQIEIVIIKLLRDLMDENRIQIGLLAGLADPKLSKSINAMHAKPAENWPLEELARISGMSRARFATRFRETVGITPGNYLTEWRIGIAQSLLIRGKSIDLVADSIGYSSASAFSRVFAANIGVSPSEWKKQYYKKEINIKN